MGDVTVLLGNAASDPAAQSALFEAIYPELTAIATRHLARESHEIELEPHALVHEAYLRMLELERITWQDRSHFLAAAAGTMRRVLIDSARRRGSHKRDGGLRITLTGLSLRGNTQTTDMQSLHEALGRLAEVHPEHARLVELRYFGGLSLEELADVLDKSPATVKRSWSVARAWLYRALLEPESQDSTTPDQGSCDGNARHTRTGEPDRQAGP